MRKLTPVVLLLGSTLLATPLAAQTPARSELDPGLRAALARLQDGDRTTVFVHLKAQVELPAMVARLDRMQATRRFRHELVVRSLQELAAATQPPVVRVLEELQAGDEVSSVVPFWIWNGFAVRGTRTAIERLAAMPEVGLLLWAGSEERATRDTMVTDMEPVPAPEPPPTPESGLLECGADFMWGRGFTGQGILVANIDTGVDGNHPALGSRWHGLRAGVAASAAWHDPVAGTRFPNARGSHGTHTMGTLCGDDGAGNQIGMAPGATWIASNPIDAPVGRAQRNIWYNQAIQWIADPDEDPATVDDVPHVCSNSWGVRDPANGVGACSPVFNAALDAAEASTVVFVWICGNEGTLGPRVPADRAESPTNAFSVGALEPGSTTLAGFSSLGPTPCTGTNRIKPEVSARGVRVRSATNGGGYGRMSGTSMATPHVAGAVALLRDAWPELTVRRAKELLMEGAVDLGPPGEDNGYGHGRIDLQRAYTRLVAERPSVAVSVMGTRPSVRVGQTAWSHIVLSSYSTGTEAVTLSIELWIDNAPSGLFFLPPTPIVVPAGFHNRDAPLPLPVPIPANLDRQFLNRPIEVRGTVRRGTTVLSEAGYGFVIRP